MLNVGFLTLDECLSLDLNVGTTFTGFPGVYAGASKEPDLLLRPVSDGFPREWMVRELTTPAGRHAPVVFSTTGQICDFTKMVK